MAKLAVIKTTQHDASVNNFINKITDDQKRNDTLIVVKMMEKAMKEKPKMWGSAMIGFGKLVYKSPTSGREVEWFKIGFSPRKANLSLNLINLKMHEDALKVLGKHKAGVGCLYINKLDDVDLKVLEEIIKAAVE